MSLGHRWDFSSADKAPGAVFGCHHILSCNGCSVCPFYNERPRLREGKYPRAAARLDSGHAPGHRSLRWRAHTESDPASAGLGLGGLVSLKRMGSSSSMEDETGFLGAWLAVGPLETTNVHSPLLRGSRWWGVGE